MIRWNTRTKHLRQNEYCLYDIGDCSDQCPKNCELLKVFFTYIANYIIDDNVVDQNELCENWEIISTVNTEWIDCNQTMKIWDLNNNSVVGAYEGLIAVHQLADITLEKAVQLDCTDCLPLDVYYLWHLQSFWVNHFKNGDWCMY